MSGLSEDIRKKRFKSVVTASELGQIMGGYDDPPKEEPDRSFEGFESLHKHIQPLYEKGERNFLVGDINPEFDFKVMKKDIDATLAVIKWDATDGIHPPCVTYAHNRVRKELFNDPEYEDVDTYAMRIGREREPDAIRELEVRTGLVFKHTGDAQIHNSREGVGSTPDGIALHKAGTEVKSFAPSHHLDCWMLKSTEQLREEQFDIFCQSQAGIFVYQLPVWLPAFYNPNTKVPELRLQYLELEQEQLFVDVMLERVSQVKKLMDERRQLIWDEIADRKAKRKHNPLLTDESIAVNADPDMLAFEEALNESAA